MKSGMRCTADTDETLVRSFLERNQTAAVDHDEIMIFCMGDETGLRRSAPAAGSAPFSAYKCAILLESPPTIPPSFSCRYCDLSLLSSITSFSLETLTPSRSGWPFPEIGFREALSSHGGAGDGGDRWRRFGCREVLDQLQGGGHIRIVFSVRGVPGVREAPHGNLPQLHCAGCALPKGVRSSVILSIGTVSVLLSLEIDRQRSISIVGDRFRTVSAEGGRKKKREKKNEKENLELRCSSAMLSVARGRFLLPAWGEGTRR
ncbi:hypothetical protein B296_00024517, partial [Ensete ventricosum]